MVLKRFELMIIEKQTQNLITELSFKVLTLVMINSINLKQNNRRDTRQIRDQSNL